MTAQVYSVGQPAPEQIVPAGVAIGVLDVDGLHLPDTPLVPIRGAIRHIGDLYAGARRHGLVQLWVTAAWARAADLPEPAALINAMTGKPTHLRHPFVGDALGELHAFPEGLASWVSLDKKGEAGAGLAVAFPDYDENYTWGEGTDAGTLLTALTTYAAAVGTPYVRSPGKTGTDLMLALGRRARGGQREAVTEWPAPARETTTVRDTVWMRTLAPAERGRAYLHSYDKNAAWLGACANVEVGLGGLEERTAANAGGAGGGVPFDPTLPGYWRARVAGAAEGWYCTPTLVRAVERGQSVAISQAHVWTRHGRALASWYERLRDARATLYADTTPAGRLALDVFKLTYAVTISSLAGQWHRPDSPLYRPDWRHAILAQGAANLSRALGRMDTAGCTPVAVNIDCVYIVSDEPDPVAACPPTITLGTGLGHFKVHDAGVPLAPLLPAFGLRDDARATLGVGMKRLLGLIRDTTGAEGAAGVAGAVGQDTERPSDEDGEGD